jgi:hypothetical protein
MTSYEIFLLQVGYAPTDSTQISMTGIPPLGENPIVPFDITVKTVLLRRPSVSIAALGSATGILGFEEVSGFLGRAGAAVTLCDPPGQCKRMLSLSSNIVLIGPASLVFSGAGATIRVSDIASVLLEVNSVTPLGEPAGPFHAVFGGAGVRLSRRSWGVDLGLLRGGSAGGGLTPFIPFLAATYRYVPAGR